MPTSRIRILFVLSILTPACKGGDGGGGGDTREEVAVGPSGFVVSVPSGATVVTDMTDFYSIKGGGIHALQIRASGLAAPASLDAFATKICDGQSDLVKETLPTGGFFVQCKGPSKAMQGTTTSKVASAVPAGDKTMMCQTETDQDPTPAAQICRSLHKK